MRKRNTGGEMLTGLVGVFCGALIMYGATLGEGLLLQNVVSPRAGMEIQTWLDEFIGLQIGAISVAGILSFIWHLIAAFSSGGRRGTWLVFFLLAIAVAVVLMAIFLPVTQAGVVWAYCLSFLNAGAAY